jgi:hypothetical protein
MAFENLDDDHFATKISNLEALLQNRKLELVEAKDVYSQLCTKISENDIQLQRSKVEATIVVNQQVIEL